MVKAKTYSRLLALLMAAIMALSLLPLAALAEEGDDVPAQEGEMSAAADDMLPFEPVAAEPMILSATSTNGAAAADYIAVEGDLAVAISKFSRSVNSVSFPPSSWIEATLTPVAGGGSLTCGFYTVSDNNNQNYFPRGALFLGGTPAGIYSIAYSGEIFATLEVVDAGSSRIMSLGGVQAYNGMLQMYITSSYDAYRLSSLFESGYISSTLNHNTDNYYKTADGSVYLSLIANNIKSSDITDVSVGDVPFEYVVIPMGVDIGVQRYMIKLADSGGINSTEIFSVTTKNDTYSATLSLYGYDSQYWLDVSEVDRLKLGIVPVGGIVAQQNLTVRIYDEFYNNASAKILQESTLPLQGGRYTLDINNDALLFEGEYQTFYVCIYENGIEANPTHAISAGSLQFTNIMLPSLDGAVYSLSASQNEVLADINGQKFAVAQYNFISNGVYRDELNLNLVDANFAPVVDVTIVPDNTASDWPGSHFFKFVAGSPLAVGATYYLRIGALPVKRLTAVSALGTVSSAKDLWGNFADSRLMFYIYTPGEIVDPAQWSVRLTKQQPDGQAAAVTYSVAAGNVTASGTNSPQVQFTTAILDAGVYKVDYYHNETPLVQSDDPTGEYEFRQLDPQYISIPPASSDLRVSNAVFSYDWGSAATYFDVSGTVSPGAAASPALTAKFYPITSSSLDIANVKSVPIPSADANATNSEFIASVQGNALKGHGITPNFYYVVIQSADGAPYYSTYITVTERWLSAVSNAVTLSGTVTLRNNASPPLTVELWQGAGKISAVTTAGGAFSFSGLTKGATYSLKIPAPSGASWVEYSSENYTLSESRSVNIALDSADPSFAVSGTVTEATLPVSGITVRAYAKTGGTVSTTQAASAATDAKGEYTLNLIAGTYVLKVLATGDYKEYTSSGIAVTDAALPGQDIALALRPYIEGLASLGGEGKGGVYVYLYENGSYVKSATVDDDGKFVFKDVKESTAYRIEISRDDCTGSVVVTTGTDGKTPADIALTALVTVDGTVTFNGSPMPNVYVKLSGGSSSRGAYTNGAGKYSFSRVLADTYTVSVAKSRDYAAYSNDSVQVSSDLTYDIALTAIPKQTVTFTRDGGSDDKTLIIYIYGGDPYVSLELAGPTYTANLPAGNYSYYYYYDGVHSGYGNFSVGGTSVSQNLSLPTVITISGKITDANGNDAARANVTVSGTVYASAITDANGNYSVSVKSPGSGSVTVSARSSTSGYGVSEAKAVASSNLTINIALEAISASVTVVRADNATPVSGAYVSIGGAYGFTTTDGTIAFSNVTPGSTTLYVQYQGYNYYSQTKTISQSGNTFAVELIRDTSADYAFSLGISAAEVARDGYITLTPSIKYNGSGTPGGTLTVTLDSNAELAAGDAQNGYSSASVTFTDGVAILKPLRLKIKPAAENLSTLYFNGTFAPTGGIRYASAYAMVVNTTLTAPSIVKAAENFAVYGTAPSGSLVTIYDELGSALASGMVTNRYYSLEIALAAGDHTLRAVAAQADGSSDSPAVYVTAVAETPPGISNIEITDGYIGNRPAYGVYGFPTFSTWVLQRSYEPYRGEYRGMYAIKGRFTLTDAVGYELKDIAFTDGTATYARSGDTYTFNFPIDTWGGLGVHPIVVTLTDGGDDYAFTIALATIQIDPSGYVYDAVTDERIEGATVTLEVKRPGTSTWVKWEDANALQQNPTATDEEGRYGWYVEDGSEYRVRVSADGYEDSLANTAEGGFDDKNSDDGFPVAPEQTEVNIALKYTLAPEVEAKWDATTQKLILAFTRPMPAEATIAALDVAGIEGEWAASQDGKTFTFTPKEALAANSKITLTIEQSALSEDGVAIGAVTISDVTVTAKPSGDGSGGFGGGSSSSKTEEEEPGDDEGDSGSAASPAQPWKNPFSDVSESDWFYGDIEYAFANGLMNGMSATKFEPNSHMTRAMLVTVLYRLAGAPEAPSSAGFSDVAAGEWYSEAVAWAADSGIVNGIGGGLFAPERDITRQDIAVVLARYAVSAGKTLPAIREPAAFADSGEIAEYARDAVTALNAAGLINGIGSNRVNPRGEATRAEVAAMLHRYIEA